MMNKHTVSTMTAQLEKIQFVASENNTGLTGLVVVHSKASLYDRFVYRIKLALLEKEIISCWSHSYDLFGRPLGPHASALKSFNSFSDHDKIWLLRDCIQHHQPFNAALLLDDYINFGLLASAVLPLPITLACIETLDYSWEQLPDIYHMVDSNSVTHLNRNQIINYVAYQLSIPALQPGTAPDWFMV